MPLRSCKNAFVIGALAFLLAACGGGGGGGSSGSTPSGSTSTGTSPAPSATHSVQLSWTAPTTRADGTALTASELSGYHIYYTATGTPASADTMVAVSGGTTTSISLALPAAGEYSFAITAVDSSGQESSLSAPVSVTVQ